MNVNRKYAGRVNDPLINVDHSITKGRTTALNAKFGGQQGAMSDPRHWMSSATHVRQKIIPVLVEAPRHMLLMDDGVDRVQLLKAMVETMATSITGFDSTLTVEFAEHKVSNAGEMHETPIKVGRARTVPAFVYPEKYGMFIYNFHQDWIIELIADPETTHPGLVTKAAYRAVGYPEFLPDAIAMTMLFIEPSVDLARVTAAWMCTNMIPKTSGAMTGSRVIQDANEVVEHTIEYTATTQIGDHILAFAQNYINTLTKQSYRSASLAASYDVIEAGVKGGGTTGDYEKVLNEVGAHAPAVWTSPDPAV